MAKIKELTALRGLFMIMIFLYHMHLYPGGGTLGVTFFFVLSGFSLTLGYSEAIVQGKFDYKNFMNKRLAKFVPLHWLTLVFALSLTAIHLFFVPFDNIIIPSFIANFLLVQSWVPLESFYLSFNSVSWYLSDTIFFVALFPFIVRYIVNSSNKTQLLVALLCLALYVSLMVLLPKEWYSPILYINPLVRLLDFVIGVYLAMWFKQYINKHTDEGESIVQEKRIGLAILVAVLIVCLVFISQTLQNEYRTFSICYWPLVIVVIIGCCFTNIYNANGGGQKSILLFLGEYSFSFYMIHQIVLRYTVLFFKHVLITDNLLITIPFNFLISLGLAIAIEKWFVNPIFKKLITTI